MKTTSKLVLLAFSYSCVTYAQVSPAATGPSEQPISSRLNYAVRYSQNAQLNSYNPDLQMSTVSGSLNYTNAKEHLPFLANYAGGYTWTLSGPDYETGVFQHMFLSQGIISHRWKLNVSDNISYLPSSPTTGFSGIPGTGEPIGVKNPGSQTGQTILTLNTHFIDNFASGTLERALSFATTVSASGGSEILRYTDSNGLDSNTLTAGGMISRRLTARNVLFGKYSYADFSYPSYVLAFTANTAVVGFQRQWTKNLTTVTSGGPEWIISSATSIVPTTTTFTANVAATYTLRHTSTSLSYNHGTNSGSGYLLGAEIDTVEGDFSHTAGANWTFGALVGYERTSGLSNNGTTNVIINGVQVSNNGSTNGIYGGAQATRRVGRNLIFFANYTGINQSSNSALPGNVVNALRQTIGFGFGYSSREARVRQ